MKKLFAKTLLAVAFAIAASMPSMAQESFAYQAVIRNAGGELITNKDVNLKFSLMQGGKTYYVETQKAKTNQYGNINVNIGAGTVVEGSMANVPLHTLDITLKVEVDEAGGTNFVTLGETKIAPVPYAMYATTGGSLLQSSATNDGENLFEVTDRNGNTVFAVTPNGIVVYVDDTPESKAARSGFIVTGRTATKAGQTNDYFAVTADGTQVFVDDDPSKAARSGFLVTGRMASKAGNEADNKSRTATKGADADLFAIDGSLTTVYVDDLDSNQDDSKAARSGFLVTGRMATTKGEAVSYVDVNGESTSLRTETMIVANIAPSTEPTTEAPAPVITITNRQVEMKSDIVMEGDVFQTTEFEGEKADFEICLTRYMSSHILLDSLLKWGGVTDEINKEQFNMPGHLKYVVDGSYVYDASESDYYSAPLQFDANGNKNTDWREFVLEVGLDESEYLVFYSRCSTDVKMQVPIQFALSYTDNENQSHDIMFNVNVKFDKMFYPYAVEKGTAKYLFTQTRLGNTEPDVVDYCFNNYGYDDFWGIRDDENMGDEDNAGRGVYSLISHFNKYAEEYSSGVDYTNGILLWAKYNGEEKKTWQFWQANSEFYYPLFSLEGVNTNSGIYELNNNGAISGLWDDYGHLNMVYVKHVGDDEIYIGNNNTPFTVEIYQYHEGAETKLTTYTYYVYKGVVLKINVKNPGDDDGTDVLVCTEFTEGESEPSFHRWLKNSGVTDYGQWAQFNCVNEIEGHPYVDLDLPSGNLWAAINVGAPSPYDWGDYLAWGKTAEQNSYEQSNVATQMNNDNDAAYQWGYNEKTNISHFCMPTSADWQELIDECLWVWVEGEDGVRVYSTAEYPQNKGKSMHVEAKVLYSDDPHGGDDIDEATMALRMILNGEHLFLPVSGFYDNTNNNNADMGYYWSSTTGTDNTVANILSFAKNNNNNGTPAFGQIGTNKRYQGLQVRAVAHKGKTVYIDSNAPNNYGSGTESDPYKKIDYAMSSAIGDKYTTYTFKLKGELDPLNIYVNHSQEFRKIILEGQSGFDENGLPKDKIKGNFENCAVKVNSGNVVIRNLLITGGGVPANQTEQCDVIGGGIYVGATARVELESGAYVMNNQAGGTNGAFGGGVYIAYDDDNYTEYRGELIMYEGAVIANNSIGLDGTCTDGCGAGVYNDGLLKMYGGTIKDNSAGYCTKTNDNNGKTYCGMNGGGVYVTVNGRIEMYGGSIKDNKIATADDINVLLSNGDKIVDGLGGGICYIYNHGDYGHLTMTGGEISGNTVSDVCLGGSSTIYYPPFSMAGDAYVQNFYLAIMGTQTEQSFIQILGELTNETMNVTCASGESVETLSTTELQGTFDVFFGGYDGSLITKAIQKFNVTNVGYIIEQASYEGWANVGVLREE
jgi:hypothetical protein